jgi:hypothetical protein
VEIPEPNERIGRYRPDMLWEHDEVEWEPGRVLATVRAALAARGGYVS